MNDFHESFQAGEPGGRVNMTIAPKPKAAKPATEAPKS
mgnify:CR=1 FL=1